MPSDFDALFADFAAPSIVEQFADRDDAGELAKARYHSPRFSIAAPPLELSGPIWSDTRYEDVPDAEQGGFMRRETRRVTVLRAELEAVGVEGFERDAWLEDPDDPDREGSGWPIDEANSAWGEVFVTFGLSRLPLVRRNELRRASV
jgi:hypothetical protein